jgi:hypothetical protein
LELVVGGNIAGTAILVGEDAVVERQDETVLALESELELCSRPIAALKLLLTFLSLPDEERESTVISKVPSKVSEQPLGGEELGAIADVTP